MVHTFPVLEDAPLLHLRKGDVLVIEPGADHPVLRYSVLPETFAAILPMLIEQGVLSTSLTSAAVISLAVLAEPLLDAAQRRSGTERRQEHLRLVSGDPGGD